MQNPKLIFYSIVRKFFNNAYVINIRNHRRIKTPIDSICVRCYYHSWQRTKHFDWCMWNVIILRLQAIDVSWIYSIFLKLIEPIKTIIWTLFDFLFQSFFHSLKRTLDIWNRTKKTCYHSLNIKRAKKKQKKNGGKKTWNAISGLHSHTNIFVQILCYSILNAGNKVDSFIIASVKFVIKIQYS